MAEDIQSDLGIVRAALRSIISIEERHRAQDALYRIQQKIGAEPAAKDHPILPFGGL